MASHPSSGWRRTVGPQWSSVKRQGPGSQPPGMQQGFHSSYLNAISRPDLDPDLLRQHQQQQQQELLQQQQQQQQQLQEQPQNHNNQLLSANSQTSSISLSTSHPPVNSLQFISKTNQADSLDTSPLTDTLNEHQRAFLQYQENQRQQQLYLQQLQLMQRLQAMPGSTTRPWYPTFGPAITTACSDSTIQLDNPNQFTLNNNAKLNRHAVGPHWRSIQTSATYSPTPSPPSSSPLLQPRTVAPSSLSNRLSTASTTTALHSYLSTTYSSAASIDHARATSFHQHDQGLGTVAESKDAQQSLQQEYYQSHSYPHDPRHHSQQHNRPSNSREARENLLVTNRASPAPTTASSNSHPKATTKRKSTWQDDDEDEDDSNINSNQAEQAYPSSQNGSQPIIGQNSIQQFVPVSVFAEQSQDQEMSNTETQPCIQVSSAISNGMSKDATNMDDDAMEVVTTIEDRFVNTGELKQSKRTKQRLDWSAYGLDSVAEANRLQSGEQVKDIFQECFYNAAALR